MPVILFTMVMNVTDITWTLSIVLIWFMSTTFRRLALSPSSGKKERVEIRNQTSPYFVPCNVAGCQICLWYDDLQGVKINMDRSYDRLQLKILRWKTSFYQLKSGITNQTHPCCLMNQCPSNWEFENDHRDFKLKVKVSWPLSLWQPSAVRGVIK